MSEPTRLSDLPNGTILRYDEAKSSHGVTLSIEQFVEWGVLVSVEPFTLLGPITPKSYLAQQLGLRIGKKYIIVEVPDE